MPSEDRAPDSTAPRLAFEIVTKDGSHGSFFAPRHVLERPIMLGLHGDIQVVGEGVASQHMLLVMRRGVLLAATTGDAPAFTEHAEIPASWVQLPLPCNVLVGEVVVRFFRWTPPEPEVVIPLPPPKRKRHALPKVTPPPMRSWPTIHVERPLPPPPPKHARVQVIPRPIVAPDAHAQVKSASAKKSAIVTRRTARAFGGGPFGFVLEHLLGFWRRLQELAAGDDTLATTSRRS